MTARPKIDAATQWVMDHYLAMQGIPRGAEASITAILAPYIPELIETLISCFSNRLSAQEVTEHLRNPSVFQIAAAKRACWKKAKEAITRKDNPTGEKISGKKCKKLRKEMQDDLFTAMMSSVQTASEAEVVELVEETRAH